MELFPKSLFQFMKDKVNGILVVNNELHKMISYNPDKGLYMLIH